MKTQLSVSVLSLFFCQWAWGIQTQFLPYGFCPKIVDHSYYSLCYENEHRQASWVKYKLTEEFVNGKQKRKNNYRQDPLIEDPVLSSDYRGSGYDRGHLLPAADMKLNHQAMSETFYMSNMSPQNPRFNRRIWASMERRVRQLVLQHGEGHVVTAGVLEAGLPRIATGVSIPKFYYKVMYFPDAEIMKAFLIENKSHPKEAHYSDFLVTVDEVEDATGFDFFSELPDPQESMLEANLFSN